MSYRLAVLTSALMLGFVAAGAEAAPLASHRAAYVMEAGEIRNSNAIEGIDGLFFYQAKKICGGWLVEQNGVMNVHLTNGGVVPQTFNFSSFESDAGDRYRFAVDVGEGPGASYKGTATLSHKGGRADFDAEEAVSFDLPGGTILPMAYTRKLLDMADTGGTAMDATVFEGYEVEGHKLLTAFVQPLAKVETEVQDPLLVGPGWRIRFAYFTPNDPSGLPDVEMEAEMTNAGVSASWLQDYGDFTVRMRLQKVEALPGEGC